MNPVRRRKLSILIFVMCIVAAAAGLVLYALRQNISLFYTPTQAMSGEAPLGRSIHLGGMVVPGSIIRKGNSLTVHFKLTDYQHTVSVYHHGVLPALFRENQGIVATGQLKTAAYFEANEILAKHDENYMPPQVKAALAASRKGQ